MISMNRTMLRSTLTACLASLVLAGCAVGPDYQKPQMDLPASYKESGKWKTAQPMDERPRGPWWTIFQDSELNRLMEILNRQNPSIAQAEAQYRQSQALLRQAEAGLFPTLSATVSTTHGVLAPASTSSSTDSTSSAVSGGSSSGRTSTQYALGANASWEPDIWGSVRRAIEAGKAKEAASAAQLAAIRLSSQAQLATAYLQLVVADLQLRQLEESENILLQTLTLTRNQYNAGIISQAAVALAENQWKTAQAQRVQKQLSRAQLEHAVAVAVGMTPAALALPANKVMPHLPQIPAGLPSGLLERRPDIGAAERNMAQANAQIGVATAAFFPVLTLSASGGYRSARFDDWISVPNRIWSLGSEVAMTVFDGGLRRAQTDQAIAAYDVSVAGYRQTVLTALQTVEDNLSAQSLLAQEAELLQGALDAARQAENIALNQYRAGTIAYLNVLIAQNTRILAETALWNVKNNQYSSSVALISAIGGSW